MSVRVMTRVFEGSMASGNDRVVLLVLADHASDDGAGAYPSQATIARKARCTDRTVRACLGRLERAGEIERVGTRSRGIVEYRITVATPEEVAALTPEGSSTQPGKSRHSTPESHDTSPRKTSSDKPSVEPSVEPSTKNGHEFGEWLDHFHVTTGRTSVRGSLSARSAFQARRRDGYSLDDLKFATVGCHSSEWNRRNAFDTPDTILGRSKIDRYIELGKAHEPEQTEAVY